MSGPALAVAWHAAHGQGRRRVSRASSGLVKLGRGFGMGGRALRRARWLLVSASLTWCALVLCTASAGELHDGRAGGGDGSGAGDGGVLPASTSSSFVPSLSSLSLTAGLGGRRALLQEVKATSGSSNTTNTPGAPGGDSTPTTDESSSWGQLSTIVALGASGASGVLSAYNQRKLAAAERERKEAEKLAKKKMKQLELEQTKAFEAGVYRPWLKRREVDEAKREAVDNLMVHYKKPMLAAAFDLQSRLQNIVKADFLNDFMYSRWEGKEDDLRAETDKEYGLYNTLYLFGEFFGWMEVIREEIVFLHGRWPTPAVNEVLDAIKFQFSGEIDIQGQGQPRFTSIILSRESGTPCTTYEDFKQQKKAWAASKGMTVEHAAAFEDLPLHSWMKSKLDAYEHFRHVEEEKAATQKQPVPAEEDTKKKWEDMKKRTKDIDDSIKSGAYFKQEWEKGVESVFDFTSFKLPLVPAQVMQVAQPYIAKVVTALDGARDKLIKLGAGLGGGDGLGEGGLKGSGLGGGGAGLGGGSGLGGAELGGGGTAGTCVQNPIACRLEITKDREKKINAQRDTIQRVIDDIKQCDPTPNAVVGNTLDTAWKALYNEFYVLETRRQTAQTELEMEAKNLIQVHEDEVKKWKGYVYQLPGDYKRLQLYNGEIRSMGEVMLIKRMEDGVDETNLMPCGYNEFLELMIADLETNKEHMPYEKRSRAAAMQRAYRKFEADLNHIAKTPVDAPKQRMVMMQILLCKLIDLLDPNDDDGEPALVKRDFRLKQSLPVTPSQEKFVSELDVTVNKIHSQTDQLFVTDVHAVTILDQLEHIKKQERQRKEAAAEALLQEKGNGDPDALGALAAAQSTALEASDIDSKSLVDQAMQRLFKQRAMEPEEGPLSKEANEDMRQHMLLSNDMDIIEKFNMKAGELERLKLAKRYRNAEQLMQQQKQDKDSASIAPREYEWSNKGGARKWVNPLLAKSQTSAMKKLNIVMGLRDVAGPSSKFGVRIAPEHKEL